MLVGFRKISTLATRTDVEGFRDQGFMLQKANLQIPYFFIGSVGKASEAAHAVCEVGN